MLRSFPCCVDHLHSPVVLRKTSIVIARDGSDAAGSGNLEYLADLTFSAKQYQCIAIRIGNERLDEQQERIDAYTKASIPGQQQCQSDAAPANAWGHRVAAIQCDGGRVQVRGYCWGYEKPAGKKYC